MYLKLQNKKGSSLVLVTIILMVLIILACMLMETVFQNYRLSKTSGYMDYSYFAAESAIQKCCDLVKDKCDTLTEYEDITYTGDEKAFSKEVVRKVLEPYILELNTGGKFNTINVAGDITATADVKMNIRYMDSRYNAAADPNFVIITLGITADSSYVVPQYTTGSKRTFAKQEFKVRLPQAFRLKGSIYSIGDLAADNSELSITGDVHVYGTSPEILSQPEQFYYGGIYAKNNSVMRINGNAYSRSFIRLRI